jgi:hypothetical protein
MLGHDWLATTVLRDEADRRAGDELHFRGQAAPAWRGVRARRQLLQGVL